MDGKNFIRLATRGSALALWQTDRVAELIMASNSDARVEKVIVSTKPDRIQNRSLLAMGGDKGLFVREVEQAVVDGRADAAVHSLKDVPVEEMTAGLRLVAFPERADPRDVLLTRAGEKLAELAPGSVVATGAPRRQAQLLAARPDLRVCDVRGNVETRVRKLREGQFDAIIMAAAGLRRLGMESTISEYLALENFVPAPGQGIVVVQSVESSDLHPVWSAIDDEVVRLQAETERQFSLLIGADCHTAAGCNLEVSGSNGTLRAIVCSPDGSQCLRVEESAATSSCYELAAQAAEALQKQGSARLIS